MGNGAGNAGFQWGYHADLTGGSVAPYHWMIDVLYTQ